MAIVTDGGLVPKGNPDAIAPYAATNWGAYDISGLDDLKGEDYEVSHRGYDTRYVEQDPDRLVPVDALRDLEKAGVVGKLHGIRYVATLFGLVMLSHQIGGFLGAWLGGQVFERTGSYDWLWYMDIMLAVGAALIHMPIKEAPKLRAALAT